MTSVDMHRLLAGMTPLHTLYELLVVAKLPRVRFHDLRHSAASLLIAEGVELVEVSKLLGHSELRVTADIYAHLQKQTATKAARLTDALLTRQGVNGARTLGALKNQRFSKETWSRRSDSN